MRDELALNDLERLKTRRSLIDHVAMTTGGLVSAVLALVLPARWIGFAGYFYFIVGVYFTIAGFTLGRRERRAAALAGATARVGGWRATGKSQASASHEADFVACHMRWSSRLWFRICH